MSADPIAPEMVIEQLAAAIGQEYVLTDEADRVFYAMDVYNSLEQPMAVVQPGTVEEVREIAQLASANGVALVPRGGGASYTNAYLPTTQRSLLVDTSRMNRIVEINEQDMYVTVEPGVTWAQLTSTLAEKDLRTPFWGPFSGLKATVGGSTSQNSASLGSSRFGISADSVLCFDIILAGGELLSTGSSSIENGSPFFRWYGPDLTGLFTGDAGALGIKVGITLRLIRRPAHTGAASFGFGDFSSMAAGMAAVAREGVVSDNFAVDPKLQSGQLSNTKTSDALNAVWAVLKTSSGIIDGLVRVTKMALAGKRFMSGFEYSAHYAVEGVSRAEIRGKLAVVRKAMAPYGTEMANTIPTVLRAMPFIPLYPILGPKGERWVPMHGVMPFSKIEEFRTKIEALYAEYAERMQAHAVDRGAMFMSISTHAFLYEPVFYWEDSRTAFHSRYLPKEYLATLPEYDSNPEGRALVAEMRRKIQGVFSSVGASHMQIGKCYPYMHGRQPTAAKTIRDVKASLDPDGLMNPGALEL